MSYESINYDECILCKKPTPDFIPVMCCGGQECGCMGMPIEPPFCSEKCSEAAMSGPLHLDTGEVVYPTIVEKRRRAGIKLWGYDGKHQ